MINQEFKTTLAARCVAHHTLTFRDLPSHQPILGDVALFEVLALGKHEKLQLHNYLTANIYPGDYILAAFGPRYATAQFEGYIPEGPQEHYHVLGMGGAIGQVASMHSRFDKIGPTTLRLVGFAVDEQHRPINTRYHHSVAPTVAVEPSIKKPLRVILSIGSSMDSGKTTSAAFLARGLRAAGRRVAFIKLTGTIFSKDADLVRDTGAHLALDFSHFGYPSTYLCDPEELIELFERLKRESAAIHPDDLIVEIADGILQRETRALLQHPGFMDKVDHVLFSSGDSLGVVGGLEILRRWDIEPTGISGLLTASPLLVKEVKAEVNLPVWNIEELSSPLISAHFSQTHRAWKREEYAITTRLREIA